VLLYLAWLEDVLVTGGQRAQEDVLAAEIEYIKAIIEIEKAVKRLIEERGCNTAERAR